MMRSGIAAALALAVGLAGAFLGTRPAAAQTDEVQVYNAEIEEPGAFGLDWHNNYAAIGAKQAAFPGGVRPDGALNGVTEFSYGVNAWFELGAYMPILYTVTRDGQFLVDGAKLRALFVVPNAKERTFFYGINFELGYSARHWEPERVNQEFRPIAGLHLGRWDLIANPIVDLPLGRQMRPDFAPAERVAYNLTDAWALAVEHYADVGPIADIAPPERQQQTAYLVVDHAGAPADVEFGIGHGFTGVSDPLIFKLILTRRF
ncbi:MAG TPA: hypothetical protein VMB81_20520 [Candidatus Sulfotelmatobacter sp.]|nr:hypothetical protein [Candidatus Sulfotelmatobacter sp.]